MLERVRRRVWGLSGRLIASYILVTLAVVVLVETLVLGFQVLPLVNGTQLQGQVDAFAKSYGQQLYQRYPHGVVPEGTVLGDAGQPASEGQATTHPDGTLAVPAITGPIRGGQAVTAIVVVGADGMVIASSAPSRYPPGRAAGSELPAPAAPENVTSVKVAKTDGELGPYGTPYGSVLFTVFWPAGRPDIG